MASIRPNAGAAALIFAVWAAFLQVGCLNPSSVQCASGRLCPAGTLCDDDNGWCVDPAQRTACVGRSEGDPCDYGLRRGACHEDTCILQECGNDILEPPEQCDGDQMPIHDCKQYGFYESGTLSCKGCTLDTSACGGPRCGDGHRDQKYAEECDGDETIAHDCTELGYYNPGATTCGADCRLDRRMCRGSCGDGTLDEPIEACEPKLGWKSDTQCFDIGFDYGALTCSNLCAADKSGCRHLTWQRANYAPPVSMTAISGSSASDVWTVGDGELYHWDGSAWRTVPLDEVGAVQAVYAGAPTAVWIGLSSGALIEWDGVAPTTAFTCDAGVTAIHSNGDDVWAICGAHVVHGNVVTGAWSYVTEPSPRALHGVWASSTGSTWVVGDGGVVLHDTVPETLSGADFTAVWGIGNDVFIAEASAVWHGDGAGWTQQTVPLIGIGSLWGTSTRDLWASQSDGGALAHYDGRVWLRVDPPSGGTFAVWGTPDGTVWSAGAKSVSRLPDGGWSSQLPRLVKGVTGVEGLAGTDETNLWLTLSLGTQPQDKVVFQFDGNAMTPITQGSFQRGVGTGSNDMWLLDDDDVWRHDDHYWLSAAGKAMRGIWQAGPDEVWVVGDGARHRTGGSWSDAPELGKEKLNDVWGFAPDDVWTVGAKGTRAHWDGQHWSIEPLPATSDDLRSVWGASHDEVWAVGDRGAFLRKDMTGWKTVPGNPSQGSSLTRVRGSARDDVWAIGRVGALFHYDGTQWAPVRSPAGDQDLIEIVPTPNRVFISTSKALYTLDRRRPQGAAVSVWLGDQRDGELDGQIDTGGANLR